MSVLTSHEGQGLLPMTTSLVDRYKAAGVAPPTLLYVDRDCCSAVGSSRAAAMFSSWDDLVVRLDVWHFLRRFTAGLHTDSHPLYGLFMAKLSACIFVWDEGDVALLREAKRRELEQRQGITGLTDELLTSKLSSKQLAQHCRRCTRGVEETETADWRDAGGLQGSQGNHGHPLSGPGEDGRHLGHPKVPSSLPPGPSWSAAVHPDRKYNKGRAHTSCLPLRSRVHIPGVLSQPPQPFHTR